jgi:hypothetical protein
MSDDKKIICSLCREKFEWEQAYQQQKLPEALAAYPEGQGASYPSVFCPFCGFLIAEWKLDKVRENEEWVWFGENAVINANKLLPPNPSSRWGKVLPQNLVPAAGVHQIDLKRLTAFSAGAATDEQWLGYCSQCHDMCLADAAQRCLKCGTGLLDVHWGKLAPAPVPPPALQPGLQKVGYQPKRSGAIGCFFRLVLALGLILAGVYIFTSQILAGPELKAENFLPIAVTVLPTNTERAVPTRTPVSIPTKTPVPPPLEVTFDALEQYPVGRLVILTGRLALMGSTHCSATCGLLLENTANPSQTVTIFVELPVGDNTPLPNEMKPLPSSYRKSDIQVRTADGTYAAVGFRLRVTGEICRTTNDEICLTDISKIELVQIK